MAVYVFWLSVIVSGICRLASSVVICLVRSVVSCLLSQLQSSRAFMVWDWLALLKSGMSVRLRILSSI